MPKSPTTDSDLLKVVDDLEDYTPNALNYQTLQKILDSINHVTPPTAEKVLSLCIRDGIEDLKYAAHVINIITKLTKKFKDGQCTTIPNFVPSALAVLNILDTTVQLNKVETLESLCFECLISYPAATLISLCVNHLHELLKFIKSYCHNLKPPEVKEKVVRVVHKLLKVLPPQNRAMFVKVGISIWFTELIPFVIEYLNEPITSNSMLILMETLELLAEELQPFDYVRDKDWESLLENIRTAERYPVILKRLLEQDSDYWHRLWIVFIKLLKTQITKNGTGYVNLPTSPINALLPCVENAFKMDVKSRCRAFACWDVLIKSFAKDPEHPLALKRVHLVMVPLLSNNAKVEAVILAKFKTWWLLIISFEGKFEKLAEVIIVPFLYFCFGCPSKKLPVPGMISNKMKALCAQAFINVIGHMQCEGCVSLTTLKEEQFNTKLLVTNWEDWIYWLNTVIRICVKLPEFSVKQIKCAWKSFIMTIGELPENNIRRDLFSKTIMLLEGLTQGCDNQLLGVFINTLVPTLFDNEENIQALINSKDEHQNPQIYKIIALINKLSLANLEDRKTAKESVKLATDWLVNHASQMAIDKLECIVNSLLPNSIIQWTALTESVSYNVNCMSAVFISKLLLWPFNYLNDFVNKEESTTAWLNLYNVLNPYLQIKTINNDIINALEAHSDNQTSCTFVLNAVIAILERKLQNEDNYLDIEIKLILQLSSKINDAQIGIIISSLAGVIVHTLTSLSKNTNLTLVVHLIFIIKNMLKKFNILYKQQPKKGNDLVKYIENIFDSLQPTLELYPNLNANLIDQLNECAPYLKREKMLSRAINKNLSDHIAGEPVQAFETVEKFNTLNETPKQKNAEPEKFTTPSGKVVKKSKKEACIINTVVENGEEFVVVKSNWKFNPNKLTDNQKEKLQKKKDIPALYQDLSQSQDEFKLTTWKTDSQDTSTTSSKSTNTSPNEDVSMILKNIRNSEFLPKIIENVLVKPKTVQEEDIGEKVNINNDISINNKAKNVLNTVISPRMALKDRVFRNVRNLIEKSNLGGESNNVGSSNTVIKNSYPVNVSSPNKTISVPVVHLERPSRVKRMPKKFDDSQLTSKTVKTCYPMDIDTTENQITGNSPKSCKYTNIKKYTNEYKHKNNDSSIANSSSNNHDRNSLQKEKNKLKEIQIVLSANTSFIKENHLVLPENQINQTIEGISSHNINNISQFLDDQIDKKIKENLCPDSNLHESSTQKNIENNREEAESSSSTVTDDQFDAKRKVCMVGDLSNASLTSEERVETTYMTVSTDINDKKIINNVYIDGNLSKATIKNITNKKEAITNSSDIKSVDVKEVIKPIQHESESNTVATPMFDKIKETITNKSSGNDIKNASVSIPSEKANELLAENISIADENTNATPKIVRLVNNKTQSSKTSSKKKSRIESQLAIDMVEGHPFLKFQSEKRLTRKTIINSTRKRKRLSFNLDNNKFKRKDTTISVNKIKGKEKKTLIKNDPKTEEDISASQDFIESSQDSTVSAISLKSLKPHEKKLAVVLCDFKHEINKQTKKQIKITINKDLSNVEGDSDIELPCNRTNLANLTEEMDTEPRNCNKVVILNDAEHIPIAISSELASLAEDTENMADGNTQPIDPDMFLGETFEDYQNTQFMIIPETNSFISENAEKVDNYESNASLVATAEDITKTLSESALIEAEKEDSTTSCNNDQRKQDFFENTFQISPIKSMSPVRDQKSPSPETSSDFVVIKLASPVQGNGEPFENCESPEIFTEDKVSPDKRDRSPPREEVCVKSSSPSLALKRNRPQMRSGGRAAQMLGLCVPDNKLQSLTASDNSTDSEEAKKIPPLNTSARRNLRILYNSSNGENNDGSDSEDNEHFLKFKRHLPSNACSPSGPILKRKLIDITDESTASPASKRKRVSFHDPPVSTTICVKKYIETDSIRSPQNSATKRLERQARSQYANKSYKKMENSCKLKLILTKTVESFSEENETEKVNEDTELSSLDDTPIVEIIKNSDLNDTDPICKELVNCNDRIENIAEDLSSPAMKELLVKKFEGNIETIGDLAQMTELEINRLCIKAPKVQVAKTVLYDYLSRVQMSDEITPKVEFESTESTVYEATDDVEVQLGSISKAADITDCSLERADDQSNQDNPENLPFIRIMTETSSENGKNVLPFLEDYLVERFEYNELTLFCSSLLKKAYNKCA